MENNKQVNIPDILKTEADGPLQKSIRDAQERMEKFRSPSFGLARELQEWMDKIISPGLKAAVEIQNVLNSSNYECIRAIEDAHQKYEMAFKPLSFLSTPLQQQTFLSLYPGMAESSFFQASVDASLPVFELIDKFDFSDYDIDFENAKGIDVEDYQLDRIRNAEPEKKIILLHEASRLKTAIEDIYRDKSLIYRIHDRDFEKLIAELLRSQQFEVELTKQTRDGGYDILAVKNLANFPLRFLVECKRFAKNRPVGVNIIRSFSSVVQTYDANKGIIFTTSYFTKDAVQYGQKHMPYRLDFRDNQHIMDWIRLYLSPGSSF